jgi:hypothetical protein
MPCILQVNVRALSRLAKAIAICIQHGMTYREAFAHVATIRSALLLNQLIIQHIDEHFGLNGKLVELAEEHRRVAQPSR